MSNQLHIIPTQFVDVRSGGFSYGVRIVDDAANTYINWWSSISDDDYEVLEKIVATPGTIVNDMLDYVVEHEKGIYIGDIWYPYEKIKHILTEEDE